MVDLTETLKQLGPTQAEIADEVGISRQHLYEISRGKTDPSASVVTRLLSFLNRPENLKALGRKKPLGIEDLFGDGRAA